MDNPRCEVWRGGGRAVIVISLVVAGVLACGVSVADSPRQELSAGDVSVRVEPWPRGMRITLGGIEVIKHSDFVVTKPPWAPHYYLGPSADAVSTATREQVDGAETLRLEHRGEDESFAATETITLHADGRVEQVFEGRFLKEEGEALIQWRMGALNPTLIIGCAYRALGADGEMVRGTVPVRATSSEVQASTLAKGFSAIEFDSRLGPLRIEIESACEPIVYDFRKSRWATSEDPHFWFGDLGTRFKQGDTLRYRVVYRLQGLRGRGATAKVVRGEARIQPRKAAQDYPREERPTIIPRPKEATFGEGEFVLGRSGETVASVSIIVPSKAADRELAMPAVRLLSGILRDEHGVKTRMVRPVGVPPESAIWFGRVSGDEDLPPEGYVLRVSSNKIRVCAGDRHGFLNAVQTLRQLVGMAPSGLATVRTVAIRDWPSLSFRGVHLFTGGQGTALHEKLLQRVIGALKMNHLVLEAEYIEWDAYPGIHHPEYGMPKEDVRRILAVCEEVGIEVTPLVMSLGHCQWMFTNDQNLDLAEDPEAKWAYCVTNPKTYDFIFTVYEEALELFRPKWFHIGHDEFTHRGRFPHRPSSKGYSAEELLMMDTGRLHAWFAERGVRVMMWGDMLLGKGEAPDACHAATVESAEELREELPEDIVIADWHYIASPPESFTSLAKFHDAGHKTVAATWNRAGNIVNFAQAAYENHSLGLLQTTWAGYSLDPVSFEREMHQYAAYVVAAEAAWNADNPPDPDAFPAAACFLDLMGLSTLKPGRRTGWTADLSSVCNISLAAASDSGWFGLGPRHDLSAVPSGDVRLKGVSFVVGQMEGAAQPAGVALRSRLAREVDLPAEVEIEIGAEARQLVVLHTTSFVCKQGVKVGEYRLDYEDGTTAAVDLVYGCNILAYTELTAAPEAPIVWTGQTASGQPVALRALVWDNPHPQRRIRSVTARSADAAGSVIVIGLTGLDGAVPDR